MNVFSRAQAQNPRRRRPLERPVLLAGLLALALGLLAVGWWASVAAGQARAAARSAAQAAGKALELEFSQALNAAEMLGMLARQSGGTITNFQKVGAEILRERPGLATLELQPGGVVSDIVPRAGNERAMGFNVLNDPAHRPGAVGAMKKRGLVVDGPIPLYGGEPGLVVRVPIFQAGRDGRETFRGFVAVSVRLASLLSRARTDELRLDGYAYQLSAPGASPKKPTLIVRRGATSFADAVRQPVRFRDTEFQLAIRPVRGWVGTMEVVVGMVVALLIAALMGLLAHALGLSLNLERALAEANNRVNQETAERKKLEESIQTTRDAAASVQAELKAARHAVHEAEAALVASRARAEAAERTVAEAQSALQTRLQEAEARAAEKMSRLEAAGRAVEAAARAKDEQIEELRTALRKAQQANRDLEARLAAVERAATEAQETEAQVKPAKPARRKRARRDDQMDLFGSSDSEEEAATETVSVSSSASPTTATAAVETEPSEPPAPAGDSEESELTSQSEATTESEVTEVIEDEPVTDSDASSSEVVAESRSEPASGLPPAVGKIEGLAVVEGLARAGGDAKAYLKALKSFAETEAGTPEQIRDALERGDSNNADKLAHELARTAAEIGAGAVHDAAMAVGRAIEGQVEPDRLEFLWADLDRALRELVTEIKAALRPREEKPAAPRAVRPPPPINLAEFRKAVHTIVPLFAGQDPGAKDCFKDHRAVFRSAFSAEAYAEFEQLVKKNAFDAALEHLKKTAKRHGVAV